jgi:hypothetical protein
VPTPTPVASPPPSTDDNHNGSILGSIRSFVSGAVPYPVKAHIREYLEPFFTPTATAAPTPSASTSTSQAPESPRMAASSPTSAVTVFPPASTSPAPEIPVSASPRRLTEDPKVTYKLVARVTQRTWIKVRMANGQVVRERVPAGAVRQWISNERFVISVGNAGAVKFELNGRPLPPFGPAGTEASDIMIPAGEARVE